MSLIRWLHNRLFLEKVRNKSSIIMKDTKELFSTKNGDYKTERKKLHQKIISDLLKNTLKENKNQIPLAFFFGGGSGSGKTTLKHKIMKEHLSLKYLNAVNVDSDEIKLYLPEFELYKQLSPQKAALLVHKESCDIRDLLVDYLIKSKMDFIYEGTMSKPQKYKHLFTRLNQEGFKIHLYISDVPIPVARKRVAERAKQDGRFVPLKVIENTHKLIPKTFSTVRDLTDSYHIYDNRKGMDLITSSTVRDRSIYHEFMKKGL